MVSDLNPPVLHYSDDFKTISTAYLGSGIRLWSASDKRLIDEIGDTSLTPQMEFTPDGQVFGWTNASFALFYDQRYGRMVNTPLKAKSWIYAMSISPADDTVVATGGSAVELWQRSLGITSYIVQDFGTKASVFKLSFSGDGHTLAASLSDGSTHTWHLDITNPSTEFTATQLSVIPSSPGGIYALEFAPVGQTLAIGHVNGAVAVVNASNGSILKEISINGAVTDLSFSSDASLVAISYSANIENNAILRPNTGQIAVFRVADGAKVWESDRASHIIFDIQFSGDGKSITAGYSDGTITTYNLP